MPTDLNAIIFVIALALLPTGGSVYQRHQRLGIWMMFTSVVGVLYSIREFYLPRLISLWAAIEKTGIIEAAEAVRKSLVVIAIVMVVVAVVFVLWVLITLYLRRRAEFYYRRLRTKTYEPKKVGILPSKQPRLDPPSGVRKPYTLKTLHDLKEPLGPKESKPQ